MDGELTLDRPESIQMIFDWFAKNASVKNINGEIHVFVRCNEVALRYWAMQYLENVKAVSPDSLVKAIKNIFFDMF